MEQRGVWWLARIIQAVVLISYCVVSFRESIATTAGVSLLAVGVAVSVVLHVVICVEPALVWHLMRHFDFWFIAANSIAYVSAATAEWTYREPEPRIDQTGVLIVCWIRCAIHLSTVSCGLDSVPTSRWGWSVPFRTAQTNGDGTTTTTTTTSTTTGTGTGTTNGGACLKVLWLLFLIGDNGQTIARLLTKLTTEQLEPFCIGPLYCAELRGVQLSSLASLTLYYSRFAFRMFRRRLRRGADGHVTCSIFSAPCYCEFAYARTGDWSSATVSIKISSADANRYSRLAEITRTSTASNAVLGIDTRSEKRALHPVWSNVTLHRYWKTSTPFVISIGVAVTGVIAATAAHHRSWTLGAFTIIASLVILVLIAAIMDRTLIWAVLKKFEFWLLFSYLVAKEIVLCAVTPHVLSDAVLVTAVQSSLLAYAFLFCLDGTPALSRRWRVMLLALGVLSSFWDILVNTYFTSMATLPDVTLCWYEWCSTARLLYLSFKFQNTVFVVRYTLTLLLFSTTAPGSNRTRMLIIHRPATFKQIDPLNDTTTTTTGAGKSDLFTSGMLSVPLIAGDTDSISSESSEGGGGVALLPLSSPQSNPSNSS